MKNIIFWQNIISPHQSSFIKALSSWPNTTVTLIVENESQPSRVQMGWTVPDTGFVNLLIGPSRKEVTDIIKTNDEAVHIFSGIRGYPMVWFAFKQALRCNCKIGIMSEPGDWFGIGGIIRLLINRLDSTFIARKVSFVLAIGPKAVEWFAKSGYSKDKIFPWGYFVDLPELIYTGKHDSSKPFSLIYCGRLIKAKGVILLLSSLASINLNYHLTIIGEGPELENIKQTVKENKLTQKVTLLNYMENRKLLSYIAKADLLVLPSIGKDGWGVVVNEALMMGTPVLCSSNCGASILLSDPLRGEVFQSKTLHSELSNLLKERILRGKIEVSAREAIRAWSRNISGTLAAEYFIKILDFSLNLQGKRPVAPWLFENVRTA